MLRIKYFLLVLICIVALSSCKPKTTKPKRLNLIPLSQTQSYQMTGKMSFSDGQDGGSGRINWQQNHGFVKAKLNAPLGAKSWQLEELVDGAKIIDAAGVTYFADSATVLISRQLGWQIPWVELKSWIIGQPFDSVASELNVSDDGFVIKEGGWVIEYTKIRSFPEGELPMKIIARKNNYSIKIAVKLWDW